MLLVRRGGGFIESVPPSPANPLGGVPMAIPEPANDIQALDRLREQLTIAEQTGDASILEELFADDAIIMAPYVPTIEGRGACLEFARTLFASLASEFDRHIEAISSELMILGDVAIDRGTFAQTLTPRAGGQPCYETGRYLWVHTRASDGRWRVRRIIWNIETSPEAESNPTTAIQNGNPAG